MKRFFLYILFFLSLSDFSDAQNIPIGTWRFHGHCNSLNAVTVAGDRVYAASQYCFFYIDLTDNSIHTLSPVDGFADINVTAIRYHESLDMVIVAYGDGNIDIIRNGNEIINISDIKRKKMTGSKQINHINLHGDLAYFSTDFGMAILDLKNLEMKSSFQNISVTGGALKVYNSAVSANGDSLFIVSTEGVMVGKISSSVVLMDRKNWYLYQNSDSLPDNTNNIVLHDGRMFVSVEPVVKVDEEGSAYFENAEEIGIYFLEGSTWVKTDIPILGDVKTLQSFGDNLYVSHTFFLTVTDLVNTHSHFGPGHKVSAQEVAVDNNGHLWIADARNGLYSNLTGTFELYHPASLNSGTSFKLHHYNGKMASFFGGYSGSYDNLVSFKGMGIHSENGWENLIPGVNFLYVYDIVDGAYNPYDDSLYIASYGYGLIAYKQGGNVKLYNDHNSTLHNRVPGAPFVKVGGVAVDEEGNVWAATSATPSDPILHKKGLDNSWTSFVIPSSVPEYVPSELLTDGAGNVWMELKSRGNPGLVVYNENRTGVKYRFFYTAENSGGVPSLRATSMALDKNGALWLGTDNGIAVMHDTYNAFTSDFQLPYFDGFPILMGKEITAIEVDGGNRKWVGTKEGLWLFNPDATEVVAHFTVDNSPLLANDITDLEVNDVTGEVFIATSKGLISFRGTATEPEDQTYSDVQVFPNPVRENFDGLIGISGLATDSYVKITDVAGRMIYETQASGGTAVWNGRNYNGEKARTGVYLIFAVRPDGQEGVVGKVAVIE